MSNTQVRLDLSENLKQTLQYTDRCRLPYTPTLQVEHLSDTDVQPLSSLKSTPGAQDCPETSIYSTSLTEGIHVLRSPRRAACPAQRGSTLTYALFLQCCCGARLPVGQCTAAFHAPSSPRRRPPDLRYESKTPATRRSLTRPRPSARGPAGPRPRARCRRAARAAWAAGRGGAAGRSTRRRPQG